MKLFLRDNWTLMGSWPFVVMMGASAETGESLQGMTPIIPARVPGSVYDDLLRSGLIEDPYYERNSLKCEWVANRFWSYFNVFTVTPDQLGKRVRLVLKGVDYHAHVFLNNKKIAEHVGMYAPCVVDVTDVLKEGENRLTVVLESAPDEMGQIGFTSRTWTQKARFGYKWDFGTRLVNLGLYDDVYLDICDEPLSDVNITYRGEGLLEITAQNAAFTGSLTFDGSPVAEGTAENGTLLLHVENPVLWYPGGTMDDRKTQPLYDLTLRTADDEAVYHVGLRTLSYQRAPGANESVLPYTPVINGKPIYIKGVNMTPLDHMYGCVTRERYDRLLTLARDAGVNLIRVWGGGIIEKQDFYELCDRYGIMVWQEFIQSSSGIDNIPSKRPEFLALCRQTAEAVIPVKRNHVSLTFWSGGNELMDERGIPSTFEDENLAMLREIVERLDPEHLMLPTSASGPTEWFDENDPSRNQDIHGPWKYEGVEGQYALYNRSTIQLHSEFGVDGVSNYDSLLTVLAPENRIVTPMWDNLTWRHHGEWWDTYSYREYPLFGQLTDLREFADLSQFFQAEGIRYAIEAHRRRSATACPMEIGGRELPAEDCHPNVGAIVWQINEPWPAVSSTCMVDYYENPKLAYYFYRDAERPLHLSLKYDRILWKSDDTFRGKLYLHNDRGEAYDRADVKVYGDGYVPGEDNSALLLSCTTDGCEISFPIPAGRSFTVECTVTAGNKTDTNAYLFLVADEDGHAPQKPILAFVKGYRKAFGR